MMSTEDKKIFFPINGVSDHGFEGEWLWCKPVGRGAFLVDNSPFQVYGISFCDKISSKFFNDRMEFDSVIMRGGHSTYRVMLPSECSHNYFLNYWLDLKEFGCSYEGAAGDRRLYAIDIPIVSYVPMVYSILERNENLGIWEFEEAHYAGA